MKQSFVLASLLSFFLTACGGSGGSTGSTPAPVAPSQPTNPGSAPNLSVSSTALTMSEGEQSQLSLSISDPDGDSVTITLSASESITAEYDIATQIVEIKALQVDEDIEQTLTITANDGTGLSSIVTVTVQVLDTPASPPLLAWQLDTLEPKRQVIELGTMSLPFSVIDEDTPVNNLVFTTRFNMLQGQGLPPSLEAKIDALEGVLEITSGALETAATNVFQGFLEVSDGSNISEIPFQLSVVRAPVITNIRVPNVIVQAGESITQDIQIVARDQSNLRILDVFYADENDAIDAPLTDFSFDLSQKTFSATANENAEGKTVRLGVMAAESDNHLATIINYFEVNIRPPFSSTEALLKSKLDGFLQEIQFTEEYEYISRYLAQRLFLEKHIDDIEYQQLLEQITETRAINRGVALFRYEDFLNQLSTTTNFTDTNAANVALLQLDDTLQNLSDFRDSIAPLANELLARLDIPVTLGSEPVLKGLQNQLQSRFIGNSTYGYWIEDTTWQFHDEYQFMRAPISLAMGTTNY